MLVIRLMKVGKKGESKYRLVVKEQRDRRDGKPVEFLGFYHKYQGKKELKQINEERVKHWISVGAQPSATVKQILGL
jgi:small subunit ribosomal protein S16